LTIAATAAQTGTQKTELLLFFTLLDLTIIVLAARIVHAGLKLHA
jgi:hypothetical protein